MIQDLNEVQKYCLNLADKESDIIFKRQFLMLKPGVSNDSIEKLRRNNIFIHQGYLDIIKEYQLNGVILFCFEFSPSSFRDDNTVEGIITSLTNPFFPKDFMEKHRMYQIGSYNTDLICITSGTDQFHDGEILFVEEGKDIYNPQDSQIHPLAKDFEEFLLVVANADELMGEILQDDSNYKGKKEEFFNRMNLLNVDKKYQTFWGEFF